ncbi:thioredoxin-like [Centroberyx affinis]|uniref:thioredoxin-like n=1 Tax=Centroberyx affinis TaxID=166261 RepID=UPI003A5BB819
MYIVIEDEAAFKKALADAGDKLVVVDFTAVWCGPCQMIAPKFEALSKEHTDCVFLKVDVDDAADVASACKIQSMPTFHFYKKGNKVGEFSGADAGKLEQMVKSLK